MVRVHTSNYCVGALEAIVLVHWRRLRIIHNMSSYVGTILVQYSFSNMLIPYFECVNQTNEHLKVVVALDNNMACFWYGVVVM
jgi:hypothetical protein